MGNKCVMCGGQMSLLNQRLLSLTGHPEVLLCSVCAQFIMETVDRRQKQEDTCLSHGK